MILKSVEQGPLIWPSMEEDGVTRLKKYSELSAAEAIQADCDVKATNIILQGLLPEVYALVSTHKLCSSSRALRMFIEQSHEEVYGCLKGGTGNSRGKRISISMVVEAWLSEKEEVCSKDKECFNVVKERCAGKKGKKDRLIPNKVRTDVSKGKQGNKVFKNKDVNKKGYRIWAFFEMDTIYAAFKNEISGSFNIAILGPIHKPIITMIEEIRLYILQRLVVMNKIAFSLEDIITPSIRKRLKLLKEKQRESIVFPSGFYGNRRGEGGRTLNEEVYGCLKGGSRNSRGKRLPISMVVEAWLSENEEGNMKEVNDTNFDEMSYEDLLKIVKRLVSHGSLEKVYYCQTSAKLSLGIREIKSDQDIVDMLKVGYDNGNKIDMFAEHFGYGIMELIEFDKNEEQKHNIIGSSNDDYYSSDDCQEIENVDFLTEGDNSVMIKNISTQDPFLNKLCSSRIMCRGNVECRMPDETKTLDVDRDDNQIDSIYKVKRGVVYPTFDPDIPLDKMEPMLGMKYQSPHQLKLALANYGVAHGYQLCLADKAILSGADNRPPMLEKDMYDSWKPNGAVYVEPTTWTDDSRIYCDVKATNIILQGLPPEVYALVSTHKVDKELWERIQMLMQGTSLTKQERECKLYDEFDKFAYRKGESLSNYYLRFSLLMNDMNIYNMKLEQFQEEELEFLADPGIAEMNRGCRVIPFKHFINNDLEYLRGGASSRLCGLQNQLAMISIPYGESPIRGINVSSSMVLLLTGSLLTMCIPREESSLSQNSRLLSGIAKSTWTGLCIVIQRRMEDLQLGVESYQKRLNLTKLDSYRSDLKRKEAYTAYSNLRGFIYQNKDKRNRLMRIDELHKFSDGTLIDVRTSLDDRLKGIWMQYLP
nr:splicing factor [Tanacetum cinerariifolium]